MNPAAPDERKAARRRYRTTLDALDWQEHTAKNKRNKRLKQITESCNAERDKQRRIIGSGCNASRATAREEANGKLWQSTELRRQARERYSDEVKHRIGASERRLSQPESDDMAGQDIEPLLVPLFYELRHLFPYSRAPGDRAELFHEWVHENSEHVAEWRATYYASTAEDMAESELAHYRDRYADFDQAEDEEVPF